MWEAAYRLCGTPGIQGQGEFPIIRENLLFGWGDGIPKLKNKMQKRCSVNPKLKDELDLEGRAGFQCESRKRWLDGRTEM